MTKTFALACFSVIMAFCGVTFGQDDDVLKNVTANVSPKGWKRAAEPRLYDVKSFQDYSSDEANLLLPFGFSRAVLIDFVALDKPNATVNVEVCELGSTLDAFGVYSNYRGEDSKSIEIGLEGAFVGGEIVFYQERFFVKASAANAVESRAGLLPCARAISEKLPRNGTPPEELAYLNINSVVMKTARYYSQSLLGYDFFTNGLAAEAIVGSDRVKVFVVIETTTKNARLALERYEEYMQDANAAMIWRDLPHGKVFEVKDPLLNYVLTKQIGNVVIGVAELSKPDSGLDLLNQLQGAAVNIVRKSLPKDILWAPPTPNAK
jgi:hypothetical protein